uniref:Peptidase M16 N-terminal domain-containing protein n=1 Tax=Arion vulgaris TaxID=1028688 RepID=A0A0B6Z630_9EUPU
MATGISRPLARAIKGRMFSAAAQAEPKLTADDKEPRAYIKKLDNGMLVGTIETLSPVSRLAVVVKAGSRYESGDNLGLTHCLRHATQLRTQNLSNLGITRTTQQLGSDIACQGTREYLFYKGSVTRNCSAKVVEILQELTTKHVFRDWELRDVQNSPNGMKLDLAVLKTRPDVRLMELLHAASFRETLGRSLYAPDFMIGKYTPEQLLHYVKTYFSAGRIALCGVGVHQDELEELANQFKPYSSVEVPQTNATFQGGEIRDNNGGPLSYVALSYAGPSQTSKDLLPSEVLRHVLGVGPHIKYSTASVASQLGKAVIKVTDSPFAITSINTNYSDAGLFGFSVVAPNSQIEKVVRTAANSFRSILTSGVTDQDVQRAKTKLKAEIAMVFENPDNLILWLGEQTINSDHILTPQEVYKLIDPISTADVNNVAKKIASSKSALVATGNTNNVPYLDKLFS